MNDLWGELVAVLIMGACVYFDVKSGKIGAPVIIAGLIISVIVACATGDVLQGVWGLIPGAFLVIASRLSRGAIGLGDGLSMLAIGPALGLWESVCVVFYGLVFTVIVGGIWALVKKKGRRVRIIFTPFLMAGILAVTAAEIVYMLQAP
ncbi:MAG: hypothetical protein K6F92_06580 [Lachnospiraceae bacterium]|nr:hypothetical protein [Lachnospiraceae bacterium]